MPDETNTLRINGWARIYDTEHMGIIRRLGDNPTSWAEVETPAGQLFHLPQELLVVVEEPGIESAAAGILDILREFDPDWGVMDTLELRRRIARKAVETYQLSKQDRIRRGTP